MTEIGEHVKHIQQSINLLADMSAWEESAFLIAMKHGLHGSKRENRHESTIDANIRKYLQSETMDMFCISVYPYPSKMQFPETEEPLDFLKEFLKGLWEMYTNIHELANKFVSPLNLRHLSKPLYRRAECIMESIVRTKRAINRYEMVKTYATPLHDLYRTNNTDESLHDIFDPLESKIGYEF